MPLRASGAAIEFCRRISFRLITVAAPLLWIARRRNGIAGGNTCRMVKGGIAARLDVKSLRRTLEAQFTLP